MDRNLALEFVRVTEAAAIGAAKWIGKGDKNAADQAAVDQMRNRFNRIDFAGTVVIGEGAKDEAPELYTGEKVGTGQGPEIDLAIDPLECTDSVACGRYNALAVIAAGSKGSLLSAPDTYMEKIAVGPKAKSAISLDASVKENLEKIAEALEKPIGELTVMVLDRERHVNLINEIREAGARVRLFTDGDVAAAVACSMPDLGVDVLMGTGGSTEAVLAAVAVKILGGELLSRFVPRKDKDIENLKALGVTDLKKVYKAEDLAKGNNLTFTATGVIDGPLLQGVRYSKNHVVTHSIVMRAQSETIRYITTHHKIK